jgi:hypothetical protein
VSISYEYLVRSCVQCSVRNKSSEADFTFPLIAALTACEHMSDVHCT